MSKKTDHPGAREEERPLDNSHFAALYEAYANRIYRYMAYRINDRQDAADLTGATFEKALTRRDTYSAAKGSVEVWLFTIAKNVCKDYLRRKARWQFVPLGAAPDRISADPPPEERVILTEQIGALKRALGKLKPREAEIVSLRYAAGLKNKEIATIASLSERHVAVLLGRSLTKLRKLMEKENAL